MKTFPLFALMISSLANSAIAVEPEELKLWPGDPLNMMPGAGPGVISEDGFYLSDIGIPGLFIHHPQTQSKNRIALIVCPGGAYKRLGHCEVGNGAVPYFLPKDVVVAVLKYRLTPPSTNVERDALDDVKRVVRLVRFHTRKWGIDPYKVGVIGWSAGANLTLNLASHFDTGKPDAADLVERESCRPDFVALLCPWPAKRTLNAYPVGADAPPAFIASAKDDKTAPTTFSEAIYARYQLIGVRSRPWQIDQGGHKAFSYQSAGEGSYWTDHFWSWLSE